MFSLTAFAQGSWEKIDVPTQQSLHSVYFTDSLYGWAAGDTGTIIHTSDGGDTWTVQDAQTDNSIWSVFFLNRNLGWAASWNYEGFFGTLIHKTTNGGTEWTSEPYPEDNIFINCILFHDTLNGWVGGSPHALARTIDGGIS
ncbi:MAG: YCF48-related protein, partial [Bacteroidota bacterium]|nr:YCF48-related protein [Bacteroidota bacterium]